VADLITSARAKQNINQATFTAAEDSTISALVTAVSKAVRRICRREFDSQSFDRLYSGRGGLLLPLDEYPILSVSRVAGCPTTVLTVTNLSAANQRATVAVGPAGLTLVRVASGITSTDTTVTWASFPTIAAVQGAVAALGNGWGATLPDSTYAMWPSTDLRAIQGALNARDVKAPLRVHAVDIGDYEVDPNRGWLIRDAAGWNQGRNNYRVVFTAGYATVPEDVQEACAQWVAALYWQTKDNPAVYPETPSRSVALLLDHYRRLFL
jgi:hypothetical protein